jgi:hypothetical protein
VHAGMKSAREPRAHLPWPHAIQDTERGARYEALAEPGGGYAVFDLRLGQPADIDGQVLIGLEKQDAVLIMNLLENGRRPGAKYLEALLLPSSSCGER